MFRINPASKRKACFLILLATILFFHFGNLYAEKTGLPDKPSKKEEKLAQCPGADIPPPPVLDINLTSLITILGNLKDTQGRSVWKNTPESLETLKEIFQSTPRKTKLEQFFQLLYLLQKQQVDLPSIVLPPGITQMLLTAKVFKKPDFPGKITSVELKKEDPDRPPVYQVQFSDQEVRFPLNEGHGFSTWDQGMCQTARELVFYPGFSFRLREASGSRNLIVDDFQDVQIFGNFGTRRILKIDLNYVDLEKVEFIRGTDQGKVKARVSQREFQENSHSRLFRFIGSLIPNTSRQRIDW